MAEKEKPDTGLTVTGMPFGLTREELAAIGDRAMTLESVRRYIGCGNVRRLSVEALDDEDKGTKPRPPSRFRVTLYDDTNHRAILIDGSLRDPRCVDITESALPPHPSEREFAEAVKIVCGDAAFATAIDARQRRAARDRRRRSCAPASHPFRGTPAAEGQPEKIWGLKELRSDMTSDVCIGVLSSVWQRPANVLGHFSDRVAALRGQPSASRCVPLMSTVWCVNEEKRSSSSTSRADPY